MPFPISNVRNTQSITRPARQCTICEGLEFQSDIVNREFWMCPGCCQFFREFMRQKMSEQLAQNRVMQHHD